MYETQHNTHTACAQSLKPAHSNTQHSSFTLSLSLSLDHSTSTMGRSHKNGLLVCATIGGIIGVAIPPAPPVPDIGRSGAGSMVPPLVCVKPIEADVCIMLSGTRGCCCCWTVKGLSKRRDTGAGASPPSMLPFVLVPENGFVDPTSKRVWFYIAQYPVHWTAQSDLHLSSPGRPIHSDTNSACLGSILATQQLRAKTKSLTFPPPSTARHSFMQLSELGH